MVNIIIIWFWRYIETKVRTIACRRPGRAGEKIGCLTSSVVAPALPVAWSGAILISWLSRTNRICFCWDVSRPIWKKRLANRLILFVSVTIWMRFWKAESCGKPCMYDQELVREILKPSPQSDNSEKILTGSSLASLRPDLEKNLKTSNDELDAEFERF